MNPQRVRRCNHPKNTWKRIVKEEAMEVGKTWSEAKGITVDRIRWKHFTDTLCSRERCCRGSNRN
jgi:hypothetical protein